MVVTFILYTLVPDVILRGAPAIVYGIETGLVWVEYF